ncbi:helix-turn-helix transcriptional regulator [Saccharopolyspora sp. NPDC049426]|uniref:PadR family transcriptional regulator n=1 Tax=Saccharopolyspora sp. NPDC049426 TaxID=3155652 RepID=UPI003433AB24
MQVAVTLLEDPTGKHWGYELGRQAGVRSGVLYPMLTRLLNEGWLVDGWEDPSTIKGRPPRRYYELTDRGRHELAAMLHAAEAEGRPRGFRMGWAG